MTEQEIKKILETHGQEADLEGACLQGLNLSGYNLKFINLAFADLGVTDLSYTDLTGADLTGARITGAKVKGTILTKSNLQGAELPAGFYQVVCPEDRVIALGNRCITYDTINDQVINSKFNDFAESNNLENNLASFKNWLEDYAEYIEYMAIVEFFEKVQMLHQN